MLAAGVLQFRWHAFDRWAISACAPCGIGSLISLWPSTVLPVHPNQQTFSESIGMSARANSGHHEAVRSSRELPDADIPEPMHRLLCRTTEEDFDCASLMKCAVGVGTVVLNDLDSRPRAFSLCRSATSRSRRRSVAAALEAALATAPGFPQSMDKPQRNKPERTADAFPTICILHARQGDARDLVRRIGAQNVGEQGGSLVTAL